jgi:hypothetical protein
MGLLSQFEQAKEFLSDYISKELVIEMNLLPIVSVRAIFQELEKSSGSFLGYRQLTRKLRRKYNIIVTRDTVMKYVRKIDPEGVGLRRMFLSVVVTIRSNLPSKLQFVQHVSKFEVGNFEVGNFEVGNFEVGNSKSRSRK